MQQQPDSTLHVTYLPLVQLILLRSVLLYKIFKHLLQALRVGGECGQHILDRLLHQDAVDETEGLTIPGQRLQGFQDQSSDQALARVAVRVEWRVNSRCH